MYSIARDLVSESVKSTSPVQWWPFSLFTSNNTVLIHGTSSNYLTNLLFLCSLLNHLNLEGYKFCLNVHFVHMMNNSRLLLMSWREAGASFSQGASTTGEHLPYSL